ncbi:nitrogen fixation protein VnfA [bacterium BMS3Bbin12]|nr:nitrogen fixation protein VnfA [bacterium BMS3Abin12]GBE49022.1 nitrogen fixation protein VnfA [bacterium BMS3Bbin12]GBE49422.1 nitrogen fixation protein VnfA [bacterium BMS3Bbin13]HDK02805.1 sigma-54-dependent Fis family transcriptional regulator [Gammaproteobacteria bacterium]
METRQWPKPSCEQIADMLIEPFVVIDPGYRIVAANRAYCRHYGISKEEVVGRRCHEVSHHSSVPCSRNGEHCPLEEVLRTGDEAQVLHLHYHHAHTEQVQLHSVPIRDAQGRISHIGEYVHPIPPLRTLQGDALLIGRSRPMLHLTSLLQRVAPTDTTVLLLGESGVGKERVASYVHHYSQRGDGPFVVVDCSTLGDQLIESELFGHEKGAFTGAAARKKGLFEAAQSGTLFIDEIGDLPLALQSKLLRALETGTIRRVGSTEYLKVRVRVVAATNRDIAHMAKQGSFRQDLYYRLSPFPIQVPALREHKDDVPALAEHFLSRDPNGERHLPLPPEVIEALLDYDYPGNVRELRNVVERAAILAGGGIIQPQHIDFGTPARNAPNGPAAGGTVAARRRGLSAGEVLAALEFCHGHRNQTAQRLGVSERTLYRYVERLRKEGRIEPEVDRGR